MEVCRTFQDLSYKLPLPFPVAGRLSCLFFHPKKEEMVFSLTFTPFLPFLFFVSLLYKTSFTQAITIDAMATIRFSNFWLIFVPFLLPQNTPIPCAITNIGSRIYISFPFAAWRYPADERFQALQLRKPWQASHSDIEKTGEIIISKTRQELYEECGITVKTINRTIKKLKEDSVISMNFLMDRAATMNTMK